MKKHFLNHSLLNDKTNDKQLQPDKMNAVNNVPVRGREPKQFMKFNRKAVNGNDTAMINETLARTHDMRVESGMSAKDEGVKVGDDEGANHDAMVGVNIDATIDVNDDAMVGSNDDPNIDAHTSLTRNLKPARDSSRKRSTRSVTDSTTDASTRSTSSSSIRSVTDSTPSIISALANAARNTNPITPEAYNNYNRQVIMKSINRLQQDTTNIITHIVNNGVTSGSSSSGAIISDRISVGPNGDEPSGKGVVIKSSDDGTGEIYINGNKITLGTDGTIDTSLDVTTLTWDAENDSGIPMLSPSGPISIGENNIATTDDIDPNTLTVETMNKTMDNYYTSTALDGALAAIGGGGSLDVNAKVSRLNWDSAVLKGATVQSENNVVKVGTGNQGVVKLGPNGDTPSGKGIVIKTSVDDGTGELYVNGTSFTPSEYYVKSDIYTKAEVNALLTGPDGDPDGGDGGAGGDGDPGGEGGADGGAGGAGGSAVINAKVSLLNWDNGNELKASGPVKIGNSNILTENNFKTNHYTKAQIDAKIQEASTGEPVHVNPPVSQLSWDLTSTSGVKQLKASGPVKIGANNIVLSSALANYTSNDQLNNTVHAKVSRLNWDNGNELKATGPVKIANENILTQQAFDAKFNALATKEELNDRTVKVSTLVWDVGDSNNVLRSEGEVIIGDKASGELVIGSNMTEDSSFGIIQVGTNAANPDISGEIGVVNVGVSDGSNDASGTITIGSSETGAAEGTVNIADSSNPSFQPGEGGTGGSGVSSALVRIGTGSSDGNESKGIILSVEGNTTRASFGPNGDESSGKGVVMKTDNDGTGHIFINGKEKANSATGMTNEDIVWNSNILSGKEGTLSLGSTVKDSVINVGGNVTISSSPNTFGNVQLSNAAAVDSKNAISISTNENNTLVLKNEVNRIKKLNTLLVAGDSVAIKYSVDGGKTWSDSNSQTQPWKGIAWVGDGFMALYSNGAQKSTNGRNWTNVNISTGNWRCLAYGAASDGRNVIIAVANDSVKSKYSFDGGGSWSDHTYSDASGNLTQSVCYGEGSEGPTFVITASGSDTSPKRCAYYTRDGVTINAGEMGADGAWYSTAFGNGVFVAVSNTTGGARYSLDGARWQSPTTGLPDDKWFSVCYGGGKFVAVTNNGTKAGGYSTDGLTWVTDGMDLTVGPWRGVTYYDGQFVAVSNNDANKPIAYSTDGIHWTYEKEGMKLSQGQWFSVTGHDIVEKVRESGKSVGINFSDKVRVEESDVIPLSVTYDEGKNSVQLTSETEATMKIEESGSTFEIGTEDEYVVEKYPCIGYGSNNSMGFIANYTIENGEVKFFEKDSPSYINTNRMEIGPDLATIDNVVLSWGIETTPTGSDPVEYIINNINIYYYEIRKDIDVIMNNTIRERFKLLAEIPLNKECKGAASGGITSSFSVMDSGVFILQFDINMETEPFIRTLKCVGHYDKSLNTVRCLNMSIDPEYERMIIYSNNLWYKISENKYLSIANFSTFNNSPGGGNYSVIVEYDENVEDIIITKGNSIDYIDSYFVFINNYFYAIMEQSVQNCAIYKYENSKLLKTENPHTFNTIPYGCVMDKITNDKLLIVGTNNETIPTELRYVIGTIVSASEVTWSEVKTLQLQHTSLYMWSSYLFVINERSILLPTTVYSLNSASYYDVYRYDSVSNSLIKSYTTNIIYFRSRGFYPIRPMSYITRKSKPFSLTVDSNSDATMMLNGINVYDTLNTFESTTNNLQNTVQASRTVTHEAPFTGNVTDYEIGVPAFATGVVKSFDFSTNSWVTTTNSTNCITEVKLEGNSSTFVGIIVGYVTEDGERIYNEHDLNITMKSKTVRSILFASHGDFYFKVNDSSKYNIGDTVTINGTVVDNEIVLTQDIKNQIIGTCTAKVNDRMIAIFRS